MRLLFVFVLMSQFAFSQVPKSTVNHLKRPKLVVGIVVDQMRWDYLYRYYNRYTSDGGFKRMLNQGFSCENTLINYIPTVTACGHTTLYTGTTPAIHGIAGNEWFDKETRKFVYCTEDASVKGVGTDSAAGEMSPVNMLSTSVCDELKLATNFRSKVIGVAFKDRGAILPAGHSADAAYWYEAATGKFITSTFYMQSLPSWVTEFNNKKLPEKYLKAGWNTLYPVNTYQQSTADNVRWEGTPFGNEQKQFPYKLEQFIGKDYGVLTNTPFGNTVTKEMAIAAINAEQMGIDSITDFLAVSFSSSDYIGHQFAPNSIEVEDSYLRLDKDLGELFRHLDKTVGKGQYLAFLSADHGAAHAGNFSRHYRLPGGTIEYEGMLAGIDSFMHSRYGNYNFISAFENYQLYLNDKVIDSLKIDKQELTKTLVDYLMKQPKISKAFSYKNMDASLVPSFIREQVINGYNAKRSGDIQIILSPGYFSGGETGTTHGSPFPYDSHIPLLWYGWNVKPGKTNRETYMTDVAPTIAAMLKVQMPSGCTGKVIQEIWGR